MTFPANTHAQLLRVLQQNFDAKSIQRGQDYYRSGRVLQTRIEQFDEALLLSGEVQGTVRKPYVTSLELVHDGNGFELPTDVCTCPLGGNCKHAVALLLTLAGRLAALPAATPHAPSTAPWDHWFKTVTPLPVLTVPATVEQRLAFVFDTERSTPLATLTVRPTWLSRLKNGGWGKPE
ncbi:MAG: SWIM zinc finger family protein, partial [Luteimonas sp.]